jgi:putative acetyltransferase
MNKIALRKIEKSDNLTLATMIRKVFEEHDAPQHGTVYSDPTTDDLFSLFREPGSVLWVSVLDGEIVGCCGIFPTPGLPQGYAELVKFYLSADARGKGIGKQLMEKSIESARELGYTHLYLESLPHYARAVGIYEKQGFVTLEQPLGNSGHSTCNIWMYKKL